MASRGKRKVDIVSESSASNTAKPPIGKSGKNTFFIDRIEGLGLIDPLGQSRNF